MNINYYDGIDPMRRVRLAMKRRADAVDGIRRAMEEMVGDPIPMPDGYTVGNLYAAVLTANIGVDGYGISKDGMLCCPGSRGAVEPAWLAQLEPHRLLAVTEAVEAGVAKIESDLGSYIIDCKVESARRLAEQAHAIASLCGQVAAAKLLRSTADKLEGGAQ